MLCLVYGILWFISGTGTACLFGRMARIGDSENSSLNPA
jgi:hypothetical protein